MEFELARRNMVDGQLRPNKVNDKDVLERFLSVRREEFVDNSTREVAYADSEVLVGSGRKIMPPLVLARLLQELRLNDADKVLICAGSTGYSAAIVAPLVKKVYMLEENRSLLDIAKRALFSDAYKNVEITQGKPENGYSKGQPYTKILIDAPVEEIPDALVKQLAEGGKIATVAKAADGMLEATVLTRTGKTLMHHPLFETGGTVLPNFAKQEGFVF